MTKYIFSTKNYFGHVQLDNDSNIIHYHICHKNYGKDAFPADIRETTNMYGDVQEGLSSLDANLVLRFAKLFGHISPMTNDEIEVVNWLLNRGWEED